MKHKCKTCKRVKDRRQFYTAVNLKQPGWRSSNCRTCTVKYYHIRWLNEPSYRNSIKKAVKRWRDRTRGAVFSHYSKKKVECACCGEKEERFLTIDHIKGGGNQHLKRLEKQGYGFYAWLIKEDYPKGYQVLCYNCNCGKGRYRRCPHQNPSC